MALKRRVCQLSVIWILVFGAQYCAKAVQNLASEDVLRRYREGQSWQENSSLHIQGLPTWERAVTNPGFRDPGDVYQEIDIRKNGNWIHAKPTLRRPGPNGSLIEYALDEEYFLTPYKGKDAYFRDTGPSGPAYCFLEDPMLQARTNLGDSGGEGLFGCFREVGFAPLEELLPSHKAEVSIDAIESEQCYVVSCRTDKATTKAWFAPEKGFALVRCTIERDAEQLGEVVFRDREGKEHVQNRVTEELTRVQFQEIDGYYIPVAYEIVREHSSQDGTTVRRVEASKVTDVNLNPLFSPEEFTPNFKDGKIVFVMQASGQGLEGYEWRNGQIVPQVNQAALDAVSSIISSAREPATTERPASTDAFDKAALGARNAKPSSAATHQRSYLRAKYLGAAGIAAIVVGLAMLVLRRSWPTG